MNTNTDNKYAELDAAIAALPITYVAHFVPQSQSRNAGDKYRSLNWRVALMPKEKGRKPLIVDYMQGIGHVPGMGGMQRRTTGVAAAEYTAAEKGVYCPNRNSEWFTRTLPAPNVRDVMYSLVLDADVLSAHCFEDWASDYGYNTDSREAERTYQECLNQSRDLVALIGHPALERLRVLFQDY